MSARHQPTQPLDARAGVPAPFEHVSAPVGRVLAAVLRRAEKRKRKGHARRQRQMHKARKRFWGAYAKWQADPSDLNVHALTDAYARYSQLQALNSLEAN